MKTQNILLSIGIALTLFLALSLVSAERIVNYDTYGAVVENDGTLNTTTNAVNDLDVSVYTCAVADCQAPASRSSTGQARLRSVTAMVGTHTSRFDSR